MTAHIHYSLYNVIEILHDSVEVSHVGVQGPAIICIGIILRPQEDDVIVNDWPECLNTVVGNPFPLRDNP